MNENQFNAMLAIIVPPIIEQITKNSNVDDNKAISGFYQSRLYQELSDRMQPNIYLKPRTNSKKDPRNFAILSRFRLGTLLRHGES